MIKATGRTVMSALHTGLLPVEAGCFLLAVTFKTGSVTWIPGPGALSVE
jgi:hypothetical protein